MRAKKNQAGRITSRSLQSHPNQPQCTVPLNNLDPARMHAEGTREFEGKYWQKDFAYLLREYKLYRPWSGHDFGAITRAELIRNLHSLKANANHSLVSQVTPASPTDSGVQSEPRTFHHSCDEDCTVDPETLCCTVCGVDHSEPCVDCGKRGFHASDCPQMLY